MTKLFQKLNFGLELENEYPELVRYISQVYTVLATAINTKPSVYVTSGSAPPASSDFNKNWSIGDIYVRTDTNEAWIMTSRTTDIACTWTIIV